MNKKSTKLFFEVCEYLEKERFQLCLYISVLSLARTMVILEILSKNEKVEDSRILYQMFETNYKNFIYNTNYNDDVNEALVFCCELSERIDEIYFNPDEDNEQELPLLCSFYELMEGWYYFLMVICKQENDYIVQAFVNLIILLPLRMIENFLRSVLPYKDSSSEMDEAISENCLYVNEINRIYKDIAIVQKNNNKNEIIEMIKEYISLDIVKRNIME